MSKIEFKREEVVARIRNPLKNFDLAEEKIEVRWDPLTGRTMRISKPKGLDKVPENKPLDEFVSQAKPCFFCEGKVENLTPMMPEDIYGKGRIQVGDAFLFPNLSGFGKYSSVCIFSKEHYISIEAFTQKQISDALKACQFYFQLNAKGEKQQLYSSINGNYLLPAGSSILHPHLQPFLDPFPTNYHQELIDKTVKFQNEYQINFWEEIKSVEKKSERFLFESDDCFFFVPFAPMGFNEVVGIIGEGQPFLNLGENTLINLANGIHNILQFYHKINHNSFNIVLFSPPFPEMAQPTMPCIVRICTRPVFAMHYRNDVTFFEKYHLETMIDKSPEDVAKEYHQLMV